MSTYTSPIPWRTTEDRDLGVIKIYRCTCDRCDWEHEETSWYAAQSAGMLHEKAHAVNQLRLF